MQITEAGAPLRIRHGKYPLLQVTLQSAFPLTPFSPDLSVSTKTCYCCLLLLLFIAAYSDRFRQGRTFKRHFLPTWEGRSLWSGNRTSGSWVQSTPQWLGSKRRLLKGKGPVFDESINSKDFLWLAEQLDSSTLTAGKGGGIITNPWDLV